MSLNYSELSAGTGKLQYGTGRPLAGSTQNKQWRIELLYRSKRTKTSGITVLNIRKLYLYFFYFKDSLSTTMQCGEHTLNFV